MRKHFIKRLTAAAVGAALCVGTLAGCGSEDTTPVVMTINGEEVHSSELAGYIVYNMAYYEQMGITADMWASEDMFDSIKDSCREQVADYYAIKQLAEENGVKLTKDDKSEIKADKMEMQQQLGGSTSSLKRWIKSLKGEEDGFISYLNSMGYTEEMYDENTQIIKLNDKLIEKYGEDESIEQTFHDTYLHAKHILIKTTDDDGEALTGDKLEAAKKKAQEVLEKAKKGEDFGELIEEYNEDTGMPDDGYYFTEGDMMDEFYQGAKACEENSVYTKLVETSYGYHIIQRLPLDEEALDSTDAYLNSDGETTIRDVLAQDVLNEELQKVVDGLDIQTNEEYDKIDAYNVHTYLGFVSEAKLTKGSGSGSGE
ncbi:MAG: peptidylprolyl isomerase [Butyricicoccaceae bacterium]